MRIKTSLEGVGSFDNDSKQLPSSIVTFTSRIGSTCHLGAQAVALTPGASTCCGSGCSSSSCCCW